MTMLFLQTREKNFLSFDCLYYSGIPNAKKIKYFQTCPIASLFLIASQSGHNSKIPFRKACFFLAKKKSPVQFLFNM